ncbi:hypothetical protein KDRO_E01180 [Kluyveromyces lactis]|nr:hypothetical protein KDRO_E01180 [Kluyveromyces lactis]
MTDRRHKVKDSKILTQVRPLWYFCLAVLFIVALRAFIIQRNGEIVQQFYRLFIKNEETNPIFNKIEFNPEDANPFHALRMVVFLITTIVMGFVLLH